MVKPNKDSSNQGQSRGRVEIDRVTYFINYRHPQVPITNINDHPSLTWQNGPRTLCTFFYQKELWQEVLGVPTSNQKYVGCGINEMHISPQDAQSSGCTSLREVQCIDAEEIDINTGFFVYNHPSKKWEYQRPLSMLEQVNLRKIKERLAPVMEDIFGMQADNCERLIW